MFVYVRVRVFLSEPHNFDMTCQANASAPFSSLDVYDFASVALAHNGSFSSLPFAIIFQVNAQNYQQLMAWKKHFRMPLRLRIIELSISAGTPSCRASSIIVSMNRSMSLSVRSSMSFSYNKKITGLKSI